jgi:hypothetical protein
MNLSRREFARLSALGLAAQLAPKLSAQSSEPQDRLRHHRPRSHRRPLHARHSSHLQLQSRRRSSPAIPTKPRSIAEQYGVPKSSIYNYQNMDSIPRQSRHRRGLRRAAQLHARRIHHPLRQSRQACPVRKAHVREASQGSEAMIDACKAANVKLMIAYRCHYETTNLAAVKLIRDGALGQVQQIQAPSASVAGPKSGGWIRPLAGGGPLMDVGIYCLNATRYLTGEEPSSFSAYAYSDPNDPRFKTVEENLSWITRFPSGISRQLQHHLRRADGWLLPRLRLERLARSQPRLRLRRPVSESPILRRRRQTVKLDQPNLEKDPIHFTKQATTSPAASCKTKTPKTPGEEGLRDLQIHSRNLPLRRHNHELVITSDPQQSRRTEVVFS